MEDGGIPQYFLERPPDTMKVGQTKIVGGGEMKKDHDSNLNLKGTFISVMAVGVIIIIMWVSIYFLYINRL
ncbi:hypothetical protein SAMN04487936_11728 [Halobacillus dabanensis]|uniref:Cytochrome c oxidase subunit 2A n=1 Tax=Halobacillus dabanensis TaxID=240302 RepID=A0A1I4ADT6_HALDA|nr:hypothetical protein SAMN04487936_11728 [Halobacillus dabanensis]